MRVDSSIEWGIRISCCEPGCNRTVQIWDKTGYPTLPSMGYYVSGPLHGWIYFHRRRVEYGPYDQGEGHIAACPQHAGKLVAWLDAWKEWQRQRHEAGKSVAVTIWDRINAFRHPLTSSGRKLQDQLAGEAMAAWVKKNPMPVPPWAI
jgi:hypothetical protein